MAHATNPLFSCNIDGSCSPDENGAFRSLEDCEEHCKPQVLDVFPEFRHFVNPYLNDDEQKYLNRIYDEKFVKYIFKIKNGLVHILGKPSRTSGLYNIYEVWAVFNIYSGHEVMDILTSDLTVQYIARMLNSAQHAAYEHENFALPIGLFGHAHNRVFDLFCEYFVYRHYFSKVEPTGYINGEIVDISMFQGFLIRRLNFLSNKLEELYPGIPLEVFDDIITRGVLNVDYEIPRKVNPRQFAAQMRRIYRNMDKPRRSDKYEDLTYDGILEQQARDAPAIAEQLEMIAVRTNRPKDEFEDDANFNARQLLTKYYAYYFDGRYPENSVLHHRFGDDLSNNFE